MSLDLIFTKSRFLLSKTSKDWRLWQEEFKDFMASLTFENTETLLDYLQMDYKLSDVTIQQLANEILNNKRELMELKLDVND